MTFDEALALSNKKPMGEPHMLIQLSYANRLVLPYKEGVAVVEALRKAEMITDSYSNPQLVSLPKGQISIEILTHQDYARYKVAALLGISFEEATTLDKESNSIAA
jgi:hypothetical protein